MKIYGYLSKVPFLKRYSFKFLFVAFLGIHIPLLAVIGVILYNQGGDFSALNIFLLVLVFTLLATVITLLTLNSLLAPLVETKTSLERYADTGEIPNIPTEFEDEAGIVMRNVQNTIVKIENMLSTQRDITSLLSHDLRTPVAEIIGVTQVLDPEDKEEHALLSKQIVKSGESLMEMLQSVLTMLRLDTLELEEEDLSEVNLKEFVEELLEESQVRMNRKHIKGINEVPEGIIVFVNEITFKHVLENLINNAIKFTPKDSEIRIGASVSDDQTSIYIKDSGIGLEPGTEEKIFDRFTRHGRSGTENEKSTGLGLYLTKRIVEMHHGHISASSQGKNLGTTLTINLPSAKRKAS